MSILPRSRWPSWPVLAVLANALLWGCAWWPFRTLQDGGLHPLWATVLVQALVVLLVAGRSARAPVQLVATPGLWALALSAGVTSAAANWAIVTGDVVRVVLLVNLAPLWTALIARRVLGEPLCAAGVARILLSIAGAALVLQPQGSTIEGLVPWPVSVAEALGLLAGMACGVSNVLMRRLSVQVPEGMSLALASGGVLVGAMVALVGSAHGDLPFPTSLSPSALATAAGFAFVVFLGGRLMRYGVARLPANTVAAVMLNEVPFAAVSSVALGTAHVGLRTALGAVLIVGAALLALESARVPHGSSENSRAVPVRLPRFSIWRHLRPRFTERL